MGAVMPMMALFKQRRLRLAFLLLVGVDLDVILELDKFEEMLHVLLGDIVFRH